MDKSSRTSNKKDKRVSFSEEIPVRQPPARSSSSNNNNNNNNNSRQESPAWFSSAGTASDPTIGTQAPGARHRVTDFTGGVSHDTIDSVNPGFGQRPQIHQTPSFGPPQIHHGPAPNVGFYINASTSDHQTGPCLLHNHNPHNPHLINGTQYTAHPHYHNPHQQVASGIATAPMAMPMMQQPQYLQQPQSRQQPVMMHGGQPVQAMPAQGISVIMPAQGTATAMPVQGMMATHAVPVMGGGQPQVVAGNGIPGPNPSASLPPDIMGVGRTRSENMAEMLNKAHEENLFEPQDFKPADDSPSRMYMVRQLDNEWIKQTRYTIDHLPHRWYITPWGSFYAVRLEE